MAITKKLQAKVQQLLNELPQHNQTYVTSFIQNSPEVPLDKVLMQMRFLKEELESAKKLLDARDERIIKLSAEAVVLQELKKAHSSESALDEIKQRWGTASPQLADKLEVVLTIQLVPKQKGKRVHAVLRKKEQREDQSRRGGGMMPLGYMHPLDFLSMMQPQGLPQEKVQFELENFHAETVDGVLSQMANEGVPKKEEKTDE